MGYSIDCSCFESECWQEIFENCCKCCTCDCSSHPDELYCEVNIWECDCSQCPGNPQIIQNTKYFTITANCEEDNPCDKMSSGRKWCGSYTQLVFCYNESVTYCCDKDWSFMLACLENGWSICFWDPASGGWAAGTLGILDCPPFPIYFDGSSCGGGCPIVDMTISATPF